MQTYQVFGVQVLEFGVSFSVLQETQNSLERLGRPATLGALELLALGLAGNTGSKLTERDDALLLQRGTEVTANFFAQCITF